ncbi:SUN domain-containing ossification factor isoform X1 [Syngnathus scovelli]|uniref:SUN domain-containing ossification factor isoform X1 n=1 Tax=Syngnathus scovelli TaxID=161590 RepID=UPI00210FF944|nr:SUN domain-containing ossification factor isoform X1 [Syngnathus scovelli]
MKRLRVLVVCLIVALLCWYPSHHAYCSEHSSSDPSGPVGDEDDSGNPDDPKQEQDSVQLPEVEEWRTRTSDDMGVEPERVAHHVRQEQTVNPQIVEQEEEVTNSDPESDPLLAAPEPELLSEPSIEADLERDAQVQIRDQEGDTLSSSPELIPAQDSVPSDPPAEILSDEVAEHLHPDSDRPADEADDSPTSQSAGPAITGAARVASAGDEPPADSFVFAERSNGVTPPELATCENSPFGSPLLREASEEDGGSDHSQDAGAETVVVVVGESASGQVEKQQEDERKQQEKRRPEVQQDNNASLHQQQGGDAGTGRESDPSVPSKDDIPTFDEWKKKVMEVEKEKSQNLHTAASGIAQPVKKVQKNFKNNYASVECGAKILSANNEAKSTSAILKENMDLYMLNPCSNKIWFVIELCEPIQVKQLDIANFELFSSTPKDFLVSLSDRYPTNKWVKLGTFHARDERIVQSFPLDEQLYAKYVKMFIKYIKVELLSHFGSEHFCPLSLFRVFGTSMVEEYEEIADSQYPSERLEYPDEDYDYPPGYQPSEDKAAKNLLGSATNAILNMVNNIAANVLGGKPELEGQGNLTEEVLTNKEESGEEVVPATPMEIPQTSAEEKPVDGFPKEPTAHEDASVSSTSPSSLESPPADRQIVTLVEEEDDEEPRQSTVTLLEEEDEEKSEDEEVAATRESLAYCPFLSVSSLSCLATLPELLQRWCSAVLAKERLRKLHAQTRASLVKDFTPPKIPAPLPAPSQEPLPLTEKTPEPQAPLTTQNESESRLTPPLLPHAHTPLPDFHLEPSRTSTLDTHGFSDIHASLTPTHQDLLLPPIKDAALNPVTTPPLQAVPVVNTQQPSITPPTLVVSVPPQLSTPETDAPDAALPTPKEQDLPTASRPEDLVPPPTDQPTNPPLTNPDAVSDLQKIDQQKTNTPPEEHSDPQGGELHRAAEPAEDDLLNGSAQRAATDFYAELQNSGDYNNQNGAGVTGSTGVTSNGAPVHGSSQKESVFMRLNNRIKALEMNMSLSGRYLEELSQRYRKQMEEMQRAFNKTVIKLQNTSRMAEEQDQKQQDSIQVLQSQLENITKLMLNLTATVRQLQKEVSDRQSYLVASLAVCVSLGLLLCLQCCRSSCAAPRPDTASATTTTVALPKSQHYPSPKRCFSSYDDMSLTRRVMCPLVRSKSFHLSSTDVGPEDLYIVEPLRFSPEKKKKRCKSKSLDKVETLKPSDPSAPLTNGDIKCNDFHPCLPPPLPTLLLPPRLPPPSPPLPLPAPSTAEENPPLHPEPPSETSSFSLSCLTEESFAGRLPPPSPVFPCAELSLAQPLRPARPPPFRPARPPPLPPAKSRQERRATKRRKSRQTETPEGRLTSLPALEQLMKRRKELGMGAITVTAVSGQV